MYIDLDLKCKICFEEFSLKKNIPKILGQCGHTICELCLEKQIYFTKKNYKTFSHWFLKCPFDKKSLLINKDTKSKNFPRNFVICEILEKIDLKEKNKKKEKVENKNENEKKVENKNEKKEIPLNSMKELKQKFKNNYGINLNKEKLDRQLSWEKKQKYKNFKKLIKKKIDSKIVFQKNISIKKSILSEIKKKKFIKEKLIKIKNLKNKKLVIYSNNDPNVLKKRKINLEKKNKYFNNSISLKKILDIKFKKKISDKKLKKQEEKINLKNINNKKLKIDFFKKKILFLLNEKKKQNLFKSQNFSGNYLTFTKNNLKTSGIYKNTYCLEKQPSEKNNLKIKFSFNEENKKLDLNKEFSLTSRKMN